MAITKYTEIPEALKQYAPIVLITNILSKKWNVFILLALEKPMRFNQLQRILGNSHSMLARELRDLEELGLVSRRIIEDTNPPQVEYSLLPYGKKLRAACMSMLDWADEFEKEFWSVCSEERRLARD